MDFRRPQPPFPLAEDDGKGDGRICEFPWSETEDIPLPEGYIPTKCKYLFYCILEPVGNRIDSNNDNFFAVASPLEQSMLLMDEAERATTTSPIAGTIMNVFLINPSV